MLLIKNISLENFMGIDSLDLEFDSNQVTAITGIPGSGKSTLMFAIALAFSGYRKGETYKSYVKAGCSYAKINMSATLFGEPIEYNIILAGEDSKKCRSENIVASKSVSYKGQTYMNNDYNQFIKDHELDSLQQIMFMFQKESDISTVKPVERAEILRRVFGFDDIQDYTEILKRELEDYKTSQIEYNAKLSELKSMSFTSQPLLRTLPEEKIVGLEQQYDSLNEEYFKLKNVDESALQKETNNLSELRRKESVNNKNIEETYKNIKSFEKELSDVNVNINNYKTVEELEADLSFVEEKVNSHKKAYSEVTENYNELNTTLKLYNHDLKEVTSQINISSTGVCHSCGQPVGHEHVEKLESRKVDIEKNIESVTKSIENLKFDPYDKLGTELNNEIKNINSNIYKVKNLLSRKDSLEKSIESSNNWLNEYNRKKEKYNEQINESLKKIDELKIIEDEISKKSELENKMSSLKESINLYKNNIIKNKERKLYNESIVKQKVETEAKILEYSEKLNSTSINYDDTKKAIEFIEKDLTNELVIRACRQLSDSINSIIKKVFPYMSVKLQGDKKGVNFFYNVDENSDDWLSISMASGGQQQILGLAYKLAVAKEFGCTSIFLDEIDSSCSIEMAKTMYEFIFSLDDFNQIFLISHKPDVIDVAKESDNDVCIYYVDNGEYSLV